MKIQDCELPGVKVVQLDVFADNRGFFLERFHAGRFAEAGLPPFVQDNHSRSKPGVLRGLHYQQNPSQGKLVGAISGRIWDVAVDIRPHSPTFGKHVGIELSGDNGTLLWVPAGFAHGFCVLGDAPADVLYKVDGYYNREGEGGIRYDDAALAIAWPVKTPIISDRDLVLPGWTHYCDNSPDWSGA